MHVLKLNIPRSCNRPRSLTQQAWSGLAIDSVSISWLSDVSIHEISGSYSGIVTVFHTPPWFHKISM